MLAGIRSRLTYANVMASIAVFVALGLGTAWALEKNSVKSKHIVDGQVKERDLSVPAEFISADLTSFDPQDGCPAPLNAWVAPFNFEVGYYRDAAGFVHLEGQAIRCGSPNDVVFTLPPGFRPQGGGFELLVGIKDNTDPHPVEVYPSGGVETENIGAGGAIFLDGISFRCGPSGENGCP